MRLAAAWVALCLMLAGCGEALPISAPGQVDIPLGGGWSGDINLCGLSFAGSLVTIAPQCGLGFTSLGPWEFRSLPPPVGVGASLRWKGDI